MQLIINNITINNEYEKIIERIKNTYKNIYYNEKKILSEIIHILQQNILNVKSKELLTTDVSDMFSEKIETFDSGIMVTYLIEKKLSIGLLSFFSEKDVLIYLDGEYYTSFCLTSLSSLSVIEVWINKWVNEISLFFPNEKTLNTESLKFKAFTGDLFYDAMIFSSSVWTNDDGLYSPKTHRPSKALTENNEEYWRAAVQKQHYDGSDWFEIVIKEPCKLNCICISELPYSQRLKRYTIIYTDLEDNIHKLLEYKTDCSCRYIHDFDPIKAKSIKVIFNECYCDENGYAEPIINRIEGYMIEK